MGAVAEWEAGGRSYSKVSKQKEQKWERRIWESVHFCIRGTFSSNIYKWNCWKIVSSFLQFICEVNLKLQNSIHFKNQLIEIYKMIWFFRFNKFLFFCFF
jgi:hypothetical protein